MTAIARATHIARPPEDVWRIAGDVTANPRWQGGVLEVTLMSSPPVGSRTQVRELRRVAGRTFDIRGEILEYAPPRRLCVRISPPLAGVGCRTCEPAAGGTRIETTYDMELSGALRPFTPLLWLWRGAWKKTSRP